MNTKSILHASGVLVLSVSFAVLVCVWENAFSLSTNKKPPFPSKTASAQSESSRPDSQISEEAPLADDFSEKISSGFRRLCNHEKDIHAKSYRGHRKGIKRFVKKLTKYFPEEKAALASQVPPKGPKVSKK